MKISVVGAGNGGQAMAGHFASLGHDVALYGRDLEKLGDVVATKTIKLEGAIEAIAELSLVTDNIQEAIKGAELIMVTTTADAHKKIAQEAAPFLEKEQIVVLNPGRTLGAIEFTKELRRHTDKRVHVAETQSLIYACRILSPGLVRVIGVKQRVLAAAYPATDTDSVVNLLNSVYDCFKPAESVLVSSLENIGAILHPTIVLLNAGAVERGEEFWFYSDITSPIANVIHAVDSERIAIGHAFGLSLSSIFDWVSLAYGGVEGETLHDRITGNPAYSKIKAPMSLDTRYLWEDIPTGILPMIELANIVGVSTPGMNSILELSHALLKTDFRIKGRTLANLNISSADELLRGL